MKSIVINIFLKILLLINFISCIGSTNPNSWIDKKFPTKSHYNENMAMKQHLEYLNFILNIDIDSEDAPGKISKSWNMLADANSCDYYIFAYTKKDVDGVRKAAEYTKELTNIVLNSFSKRRQYSLINEQYAGYTMTLPPYDKLKSKCNFTTK